MERQVIAKILDSPMYLMITLYIYITNAGRNG